MITSLLGNATAAIQTLLVTHSYAEAVNDAFDLTTQAQEINYSNTTLRFCLFVVDGRESLSTSKDTIQIWLIC